MPLDSTRRDRRLHRAALRLVRIAVMAHHVLAHQPRHQPAGLFRTEDVDPLFPDVDVVTPCEDNPVKLRDKGDRRFGPQPRDIETRGGLHVMNPAALAKRCKAWP